MSTKFRSGRIALYVLICTAFFLSSFLAGEERDKRPYTKKELFRIGPQQIFEAPFTNEIAFPLGGIGTGMVSLGGRGNLRDWEIFNRPGKGINLPKTFFSLYFQQEGRPQVVRVLEGFPSQKELDQDHKAKYLWGLPRMEKAAFTGTYPKARIEMSDRDIPLAVVLEAFNPFIPLDPEESGIPAFVVRFRIRNLSSEPASISIMGSIMNPIGYDGKADLKGTTAECFGQNITRLKRTDSLSGLYMNSGKVPPDSPLFGTLALATPWKDINCQTHWERGAWPEAQSRIFWTDFSDDGLLNSEDDASPSEEGKTDIGSLGAVATLAPNEEIVLPFILSWNFPNMTNYMGDNWFDGFKEERGRVYRTNYSNRFSNAWDSAEYLQNNLADLEAKTDRFCEVFFSQTLPDYVLEAVSSQASIIRTPTCFWLEDGGFFGFEGCSPHAGCCPLNCTIVWPYAQSLAYLFPSLERSMRESDFLNNTRPDGDMAFRTTIPLEKDRLWDQKPAAQGQMSRIMSLYRDWRISGDDDFLRKVWPQAKKALEYAWMEWDKDRDGIMEGEQHSTYDVDFYGPNSLITSLYLGALRAGAEMAAVVGDKKTARTYRDVFEKGMEQFDKLLWNGEYYIQNSDKVDEHDYQYGQGCLSDQVLGEWLSLISGSGRFLPEDRIKTALRSIYKYNFLLNFRNHSNAQRVFALGDDKGLLICSWPNGGRPRTPVRYADEVWTGVEYQVASHMIYEGLLEEGLTIVRAVRERHDGRKRNPWNEEECGDHYARALASWGVLLALTGQDYSGPDMSLTFDPKINQKDFKGFWSLGSGWGGFSQKAVSDKKARVELSVAHGELKLSRFKFRLPPTLRGKTVSSVRGRLEEKPVDFSYTQDGGWIVLNFKKPETIPIDQNLEIDVVL